MGVITLDQAESVPDALTGEHFNLILGTLPGGITTDLLTIKCLTAAIPGFSNETVEVNFAAYARKFRGRKMYPRTISLSWFEDVRTTTLRSLRQYHEYIVGSRSGVSQGYIRDYSVPAVLQIYDTAGRLCDQSEFGYFFLQDVQDIQLSSENSASVQVNAVFNYDWVFFQNIQNL